MLVDPKDSKERAKLIVEAACMPQLFSDLQDEYGPDVPSDENLKAFLLKRGFSPNTVEAPIRAYRDTIEFAVTCKALYSDDEGDQPLDQAQASGKGSTKDAPKTPDAEVGDRGFDPKLRHPPVSETAVRQDVFSIEEGAVTIQWPVELSSDSLKDIEDWLMIVKRKIARSVAKPEIKAGDDPFE